MTRTVRAQTPISAPINRQHRTDWTPRTPKAPVPRPSRSWNSRRR